MLCGPSPCISSCIRMCVKNASNDTSFCWAAGSVTFAIGRGTLFHFSSCTVLRLHAARAAAGRENHVHDPDGRHRTQLRSAVLRIDRQRVLELLEVARKRLQLLRLGIVSNGDEGFEGGLGVEPLVLVNLVRTDGRLDGG